MWWSVTEDSGQCAVLRWGGRGHTSYVKKLFWSFVFWLRLSSNAFGSDCLEVWPQLYMLFFVCLWPDDFPLLFFLVKNFAFSNSAGQLFLQRAAWWPPSQAASPAPHTLHTFFQRTKESLNIILLHTRQLLFFKQLQPEARTAFQGTSNFRRMGKMCPKWSCLSEAESSGGVESPLSLVAQSRSSADYGLNGEHPIQLRLIHPPISIIQEAGSIFVSQQIKTQCKTFAFSTSNIFWKLCM